MSSFHCSAFNLDGIHSTMEMLLSSLFDGSYNLQPIVISASNGCIEYTYTKEAVGNKMTLRVVSLNRPQPFFTVRHVSKPFAICPITHPLLDLSQMNMPALK